MRIKESLRFKFFIGFLVTISPLVMMLFYLNQYGMNVVRTTVAESNHNLLSVYMKLIDQSLSDTEYHLANMMNHDAYIKSFNWDDFGKKEYIFSKYYILNRFKSDIAFFDTVDAFFLYNERFDDLLATNYLNVNEKGEKRRVWLKEFINVHQPKEGWHFLKYEGEYALINIYQMDTHEYLGSWTNVKNLMEPLNVMDLGEGGEILLLGAKGIPLMETSLPHNVVNQLNVRSVNAYEPYKIIDNGKNDTSFLITDQQSEIEDLSLAIVMPEANLLKSLPLFQRTIYLIPIGLLLILIFYLIFIQRILIQPIRALINGMVSVANGNLENKVNNQYSGELKFLIQSFNKMVLQIKTLKIGVYEEKIKTQEAEFKHLQAQINPHFYMNTLNMIYNMAALKDFKSVQQTVLYLSNYFRFIMRTNRSSIPLIEEIKHVENYLEIQKLRYPDHLAFNIEVDERYRACIVPPLSIHTFVENCMVHGFNMVKQPFFIEIAVKEDEENRELFFRIFVRDNGVGFSSEKLKELHSEQYFSEPNEMHVGIVNVYHRIKMKYGVQSNIHFENNEEHGATVCMRLPIFYKE